MSHLVRNGRIWLGIEAVRFGLEWSRLVWNGHICFEMNTFAFAMSHLDLQAFIFGSENLYNFFRDATK